MKIHKIRFKQQLGSARPDTARAALAISLRNKNEQKLTLAYLDLASLELRESTEVLDWWLKVEECVDGKVILNGYKDPGIPKSKAIYVYDIKTDKILWHTPSSHFHHTAPGGLWVEDLEQKLFLDLETGIPIAPLPPEEAQQKSEEDHKQFLKNYKACNLIFSHYEEFPSLQTKIERFFGHKLEEHLDHLEFEGKEIFSYPVKRSEQAWDQHLGILENGKVIISEKTGDKLKGTAFYTFFIWHKFLIWQEGYQSLCFSELG